MGALINSNNISNIYCGGTKIKTIYAGDKVVYKSDAIDPTYNYFVLKVGKTGLHNTVSLQDYRAGDETEWDGYTDWGDGTRDKELAHIYEKPGIYTIKTKWMITKVIKVDENNDNLGTSYFLKEMLIGCDNINTNITDVRYLFWHCGGLKYADLSRLDVSKFTDMAYMFYYCSSLEELNMEGWDTSNVINMRYMFSHCEKLTPQVSHFNTSKVIDFMRMFEHCSCLDGSQFTDWDTSSAKYMTAMFMFAKITNKLDMSTWNMSNVYYMNDMCYGTRVLDGCAIGRNISSSAYVYGAFSYTFCSYCINVEHHVSHGNVSDSVWEKMKTDNE